jgi:hypothetical protein
MIFTIAIIALCIIPPDEATGVVCDEVSVIEKNAFFDDAGRHVFDQFVFWRKGEERPFDVSDWRLAKGQSITRDFARNRWTMTWHDGQVTRRVEARMYRETFRQYDIELTERDHLPKERRLTLLKLREQPHVSDLETP